MAPFLAAAPLALASHSLLCGFLLRSPPPRPCVRYRGAGARMSGGALGDAGDGAPAPAAPPSQCSASIFLATSRDGYIADEDGKVDWLNDLQSTHPMSESDGDGGFSAFLSSVDALIMGRNTYETVLGFLSSGAAPDWPYGTLPTFVLSSRPETVEVPESLRGKVEVLRGGEPRAVLEEVAARLERREGGSGAKARDVYVDGGATVRRFLDAGLVRRAVLTTVPATLGGGVPLFTHPARRDPLEEVEARRFDNGFVQTTYRIRGKNRAATERGTER